MTAIRKYSSAFQRITAGLLAVCMITQVSCVSTSKAVYFSDGVDAEVPASNTAPEVVLAGNDIISISVSSMDPQASDAFNALNTSGAAAVTSGGNIIQSAGYLVNPEGMIKFPFIGKVMAAGLTANQLSDTITKELVNKKLLMNPVVNVRRLNFKVTVLGEVNHPSVFTVPNEKISVLEAIGLAGDLTIFGKRGNILLIREEKGVKITRRLNLNSKDLLNSPYYYLKTNDVVYVEPNKARVAGSGRANQWLPVVFAGLSFAVVFIDRLAR